MARTVNAVRQPPGGHADVPHFLTEALNERDRIEITPEERRRLAECCAFFKAEQYRAASPESIRRADIACAEIEIDEIVRSTG
jgi:hypothetical protein